MNGRNTHISAKEISVIDFCGVPIIWGFHNIDMYDPPIETKPTIGSHDYNNCKECQTHIERITTGLRNKYEGNSEKKGFPFCCPFHSNLVQNPHFKKEDFDEVPEMIAFKVVFTHQHIINNINSDNWYKTITDYIEYTIMSFGQMPKGCGIPLYLDDYYRYVIYLIENTKSS